MDSPSPLMAGGIAIRMPSAEDMQLNMLLWGDSGAGKTTLAATAPGHKLFVLLDPGGDLSLVDRTDVSVLNLSGETPLRLVSQFRMDDPWGIGAVLKARPDYETVVIDSMTTLAYVALQNAVRNNPKTSTMEIPGRHAYGQRNGTILAITVTLMRMCQQYKRHLILVTHEGLGEQDDKGVTTSVTMALSKGVANHIGLRFNEVWHLADTGTERRIAIRACRTRTPMKTRLFTNDKPEFVWHYDADTQVGEGIADWYHAWQQRGGKKLPLPTKGGAKK